MKESNVLLFLCLGSAIGIGNFYAIPQGVFYHGGLAYLLLHFLGLTLFAGVLLIAELLFAAWLQKSFVDSFRTLDRRFAFVPFLSFFAVGLITPNYITELAKIALMVGRACFSSGYIGADEYRLLAASPLSLYVVALGVLGVALVIIQSGMARVSEFMKITLLAVSGFWICLSYFIGSKWHWNGLAQMLSWKGQQIESGSVYDTLRFSLFTLSSGFGLFYSFYHSTIDAQRPKRGERPRSLRINVLKMVIFVMAADFASSLFAVAFVSPFQMPDNQQKMISSTTLLLDWLPQILARSGPVGIFFELGFFISLFLVGLLAVLALVKFEVVALERDLKWTRLKASVHVGIFGVLTLLIPLFPKLSVEIESFAIDLLLPLGALFLCYFVGWRMPRKAQSVLFGRSLLLDGFLKSWRILIRVVVPLFLIFVVMNYLVRLQTAL